MKGNYKMLIILIILIIFLIVCIAIGLTNNNRKNTMSNTQLNNNNDGLIINENQKYDYAESDLQLKFNLLNNKLKDEYKKIEKKNKSIKLARGIAQLIQILLSALVIYFGYMYAKVNNYNLVGTKEAGIVYIGAIIVLVLTTISMICIIPSFRNLDYTDIDNSHIHAIHQLLADTLDVPIMTIEYELNSFIHGMKAKQGLNIISMFYTDYSQFELVYDRLRKNIKKDSHEETLLDLRVEKSQLDIEHKQLENEGLKIDNDIKNFWECKYCGSANYGNEKKCSSCGATRLVIKLKSRNEV